MHNITLIGTIHHDKGNANFMELYNIIKRINPEIIFEEKPQYAFDEHYKDFNNNLEPANFILINHILGFNKNNLEEDAIKMYLGNHQIEHIPVDSYNTQDNIPATFFRDNGGLHERIEKCSDEYCKLHDLNEQYIKHFGFKYLNDIFHDNLNENLDKMYEKTLQSVNDQKSFDIHNLWNDINDKREFAWITNIYSYCKNHQFDKGLFLFGAAHRYSIIKKIQEHNVTDGLHIKWNCSNYDGIL